jgi:glycosyltransferase involved in cell wall biosynthesis
MDLSIAMCTYNGARFLAGQLQSFAAQTRVPDEVIICDDCSTDGTKEILTSFAAGAAFPVKLHFNDRNLGYLGNFEKAVSLCTGDIIVLSDQDDVWRGDKLKAMEAEFGKSEKVGMIYANAEIVDESLNPLGQTLWQRKGFDADKQELFANGKAFDLLLADGYVYGSSMAFRSIYRDLVLPFPEDTFFIHDNWIALLISAVADVSLIDELLIKYRQHRHQSVGMGVENGSKINVLIESGRRVNQYDGTIKQLFIAEKKLAESGYGAKEAVVKIVNARNHIMARADLPKNIVSRVAKVGRELLAGNYHHYSNGFRSAVKDLLLQ